MNLIFYLSQTNANVDRYTDFQVNEIGEDGKVLHLKVLGNGEQEEVR
jgi:hypothetical protein